MVTSMFCFQSLSCRRPFFPEEVGTHNFSTFVIPQFFVSETAISPCFAPEFNIAMNVVIANLKIIYILYSFRLVYLIHEFIFRIIIYEYSASSIFYQASPRRTQPDHLRPYEIDYSYRNEPPLKYYPCGCKFKSNISVSVKLSNTILNTICIDIFEY